MNILYRGDIHYYEDIDLSDIRLEIESLNRRGDVLMKQVCTEKNADRNVTLTRHMNAYTIMKNKLKQFVEEAEAVLNEV